MNFVYKVIEIILLVGGWCFVRKWMRYFLEKIFSEHEEAAERSLDFIVYDGVVHELRCLAENIDGEYSRLTILDHLKTMPRTKEAVDEAYFRINLMLDNQTARRSGK